MKTRLLYLEYPSVTESECQVLDMAWEGADVAVVVDRTPFYPKGGGQPSDRGWLTAPGIKMRVEKAFLSEDRRVLHCGRFEEGTFKIGQEARAAIDADARSLNSRVHTAGEVICGAVHRLGRRWVVSAAGHVPGQSRVAFQTDLSDPELAPFVVALQQVVEEIVARNYEVRTHLDVPADEVMRLCPLEPIDHLPEGAGIRLVSPCPDFYRPCLGAHLTHTGDIGRVVFKKARLKKRELSLTYDVV